MPQTVYIIDDDDAVRDSISMFFESENIRNEVYVSAEQFLATYDGTQKGCLVADIRMQGLSGLELQLELNKQKSILPIIFITGHGDVPMAVEAMRHGAIDFLRKPVDQESLLKSIRQAFERESDVRESSAESLEALANYQSLTAREQQVFQRVTKGELNKNIAVELGISERTVEVHRSSGMKKMGAKTFAQLVRLQILLS